MVLAALILVTSTQGVDGATRGIRGSRQHEQLDSLSISENNDVESLHRTLKKKKMHKRSPSPPGTADGLTGRFDIPAPTAAPAPTSATLTHWIDGCSSESLDVTACAGNNEIVCKQCLFGLSQTSATPSDTNGGINACSRNQCDLCTVEDLMPFFECGYKVNVDFKNSIPDPVIQTQPPLDDSIIIGRLDIPAVSAESAPSSLDTWLDGCSNESLDVTSCAANDEFLCKQCLYSLSLTSVTLGTSFGGITACARNFCGTCSNEDIKPFFECGYKIDNGIVDSVIPDSSIRTPPPANFTDNALVTPVIDDLVVDTVNCPAVYPRNETCVMVEGFEFKSCRYYEVGMDVKCECSLDQPIWNCTGTITNEDYIEKTENSEVATDEEESEEDVQPLPGVDALVSRIGGL